MKNLIWSDGALISDTERVFSIDSRLRYGDGIFDTLLVEHGKPSNIFAHYERLIRHAQVLNLNFSMSQNEFFAAAEQLVQAGEINSDNRYALNSWVIRGAAQRGLMPTPDAKTQIIMKLSLAPSAFSDIHACIVNNVRRNEGSPLSRVKSCNYGDNILAIQEAHNHGCNEAVIMNNAGHICCTSIGNIFCMEEDTIITPPLSDGVIDGTVRMLLIERYGAIEKSITKKMLQKSEFVFMSNSLRGIQFFKTLNGRKLSEKTLNIDKDFHVIS